MNTPVTIENRADSIMQPPSGPVTICIAEAACGIFAHRTKNNRECRMPPERAR
ncbi:hypothetical protein [Aromatoleum buckelii]|uniref:Uncharacterized protein n=1 Tax=Aromatoleum buckelii TaxID=200254 RepID=A0ABX1N544_9RHOO|nr:hypothetical protein [Aromatoleum buckelii]MCK0511595.1 hypothetical protein [Aromatoleum buckelii]